jgi:hypothetical protein
MKVSRGGDLRPSYSAKTKLGGLSGFSASFSIRRRAGGLYYSLDCGHRGSIQMRIINDLTLHSLAFGFQKFLEVLQRGRQVGGQFTEFIYRI